LLYATIRSRKNVIKRVIFFIIKNTKLKIHAKLLNKYFFFV